MEIRGLQGNIELFSRDKYNLTTWNLAQLSTLYGDIESLRYFTKKLYCHVRMSLRSPPIVGFSKLQESAP